MSALRVAALAIEKHFPLRLFPALLPIATHAVSSAAIRPAAPVRLSITTCWPTRSATFCPTSRAITSCEPPGVNGTMKRMGFVGYPAARASAAVATSVASTIKRIHKYLILFIILSSTASSTGCRITRGVQYAVIVGLGVTAIACFVEGLMRGVLCRKKYSGAAGGHCRAHKVAGHLRNHFQAVQHRLRVAGKMAAMRAIG